LDLLFRLASDSAIKTGGDRMTPQMQQVVRSPTDRAHLMGGNIKEMASPALLRLYTTMTLGRLSTALKTHKNAQRNHKCSRTEATPR